MKRDWRLGTSFILNLVLVVGIIALVSRQTPPPAPVDSLTSGVPDGSAPRRADAGHAGGFLTSKWIDQLRASGIPNPVLARLVAADFEDRWEQQRRDLHARLAAGDLDPQDLMRFEAQHEIERERELRAALGDEGFRQWDKETVLRDFDTGRVKLSATEGDAVYDLKKQLTEQQRELIRERLEGERDEDDVSDQQAALQKEFDQQLKSVLGDERYATLHNTESGTEGTLRRALKGVNATDDQAAAILAAQTQWTQKSADFERQLADHPLSETAYQAEVQAMEAARDAEFERVLGPAGFSEFQKAGDNRYQMMKHYASAWNLSDTDIDHLYDILREYDRNTRDYKRSAQLVQAQGQTVDWTGVQENLQTFSQQTEEALRAYLGNDRFLKLNDNNVLELEH